MSLRMFVGGLSFNTREPDLVDHFRNEGGYHVEDAIIMRDRVTNHSRGFGFVVIKEEEGVSAEAVRDVMNGKKLGGRALTVNKAEPKGTKEGMPDASRLTPRH